MKSEQDRIARSLAQIDERASALAVTGQAVEDGLRGALDLLSDCHAAYLRASNLVRRMYNQAFFEAIYIADDELRVVLAEPFQILLGGPAGDTPATAGGLAHAAVDDPDGRAETGPEAWTAEHLEAIRRWPLKVATDNKNKPSPGGEGLKQTVLVHLREALSSASPLFSELLAARDSLKDIPLDVAPAKTAPKPNRKLQPDEVDQLVADYLAGANIDNLARSFGMHRQTVRNHLLRRSVTLRSDSPALTETQIDRLVELYATGLSTIKLGAQFGVGATTVRMALKARGVKLRDRSGR